MNLSICYTHGHHVPLTEHVENGSCWMQGESHIMSHLHHIATSDIAVSTDQSLVQEGKTKVFVTF